MDISNGFNLDEVATFAVLVGTAMGLGYYLGRKLPNPPANQTQSNIQEPIVNPAEDWKLALVVRTDLSMTTGKVAAHHATLACYKNLLSSDEQSLRHWEKNGQTKVTLRCANEEELLTLQTQARSLRLCAHSIQDAGRTQIAAGSRTVLGILGPVRLLNQVTGKLRLL